MESFVAPLVIYTATTNTAYTHYEYVRFINDQRIKHDKYLVAQNQNGNGQAKRNIDTAVGCVITINKWLMYTYVPIISILVIIDIHMYVHIGACSLHNVQIKSHFMCW